MVIVLQGFPNIKNGRDLEMDLKEFYETSKYLYERVDVLEKENRVLSNKAANLEKELEAYRKTKDKYELVIESDKFVIQEYEREIERLKNRNKLLEEESAKNKADLGVKKPERSDAPVEYRMINKNGRVHRYCKVEEKSNNGIKLVRWSLMD